MREISKIRNPLLEEYCAFWKSYVCSDKFDVQEKNADSHSSTESEIMTLDTGLRLDGFLALELWDLIVSLLGKCFSCFR